MSRRYEPRLRAPHADVLIAAGLLAVAQAEIWRSAWSAADAWPETAVAAAAATIASRGRRRALLAVLTVVMVAFGASIAELPVAAFVLPTSLLAVYSLAAHAGTERAVVGLGVALAMLGSPPPRRGTPRSPTSRRPPCCCASTRAVGRHPRARRHREAVLDRE